MTVLGLLLLGNAILHGVIIGRFGMKGNEPPAVFGILYPWRPNGHSGKT
jgi:hypothetical protein